MFGTKRDLYEDYKYLGRKDKEGKKAWSDDVLKPMIPYGDIKLFDDRFERPKVTGHLRLGTTCI